MIYKVKKVIYKTRYFNKWARKHSLNDLLLRKAVLEIRSGLIDANLGGGVVKKRIALTGRGKRSSTRTLLATNLRNKMKWTIFQKKNC